MRGECHDNPEDGAYPCSDIDDPYVWNCEMCRSKMYGHPEHHYCVSCQEGHWLEHDHCEEPGWNDMCPGQWSIGHSDECVDECAPY